MKSIIETKGHHRIRGSLNQRGAALIVSLIILLVLTLLGVASMQSTGMESIMARNHRDQNTTFQSAESALRAGEAYVETLANTTDFNDTGTNGVYTEGNAPDPLASASWGTSITKAYSGFTLDGPTSSITLTAPRYYIEHVGTVGSASNNALNIGGYGQNSGQSDIDGFKITARAVSPDGNTETILQSYYGKAF